MLMRHTSLPTEHFFAMLKNLIPAWKKTFIFNDYRRHNNDDNAEKAFRLSKKKKKKNSAAANIKIWKRIIFGTSKNV